MSEICQLCGTEKIMHPAGISTKSGKPKPYDAFWACPNFKNHGKDKPPQNSNTNNKEDVIFVKRSQWEVGMEKLWDYLQK